MRSCTAVVERCPDTGLYVGYVPGFPGAYSQGETLEELNDNLKEVIAIAWKNTDCAKSTSYHVRSEAS